MKRISLILLTLVLTLAFHSTYANTDTDSDGFLDEVDAFPEDPAEWLDTDNDGIGNNADTDDDNDGRNDGLEDLLGSDPLDDTDPPRPRGVQYLVTPSSSQNVTEVHILNSSGEAQAFKGSLYAGDGSRLGPANVALGDGAVAANGRLVLLAEDLEQRFNVSAWSGPAMLEVFGETNFELMSKLTSPSGLVSNTNCVREDRVINIEGTESSDQSYIRFINDSDDAITDIRGTLYSSSGNVIGSQDIQLVASLAPNAAVFLNRDDLVALTAAWTGQAMLVVDNKPGLKLLNLNLVNSETYFNFSCVENNESKTVYLQTTSTSLNVSYTHIVNTSDVAQSYTGTLYNRDGEQLGTAMTALSDEPVPARGRLILTSGDIEQIFGVDPWSGPASLEVFGSGTYELMTRLTSPSGLISNTNCTRQASIHNIEPPGAGDLTYIRFINRGTLTIPAITGSLYSESGDVIGDPDQVLVSDLVPNEAVWVNRDQLADIIGSTWTGDASLKVLGPSTVELINLNLVNGETFFNFSCFEFGGNEDPEFDETDTPMLSVDDAAVLEGQAVTFTVTPGTGRQADPQGDTNSYTLLADGADTAIFADGLSLSLTPPLGSTDYSVRSDSSRNTGVTATSNTVTVTSTVAEEEDSVAAISTQFTRNTSTVFSIDASALSIQVVGPDPASSTGTCEAFLNGTSLGTFALVVGGVTHPNTHSLSNLPTYLQSLIGGPGTYIYDSFDLIEVNCTTTNSTGASSTYKVFTNEGDHVCSSGCRKNN